jgi:hypothetical protein
LFATARGPPGIAIVSVVLGARGKRYRAARREPRLARQLDPRAQRVEAVAALKWWSALTVSL